MKRRTYRDDKTYMQDICVCGHDENNHSLGFFTGKRQCSVQGCDCKHYQYARRERRFKAAR